MEHELKINKTENGTEGVLSLRGDLTVNCARESRDVLLEALQKLDSIRLDLSEVESVDVSLIQLICATSHECLLSGKTIALADDPGNVIHDLLYQAGYQKQSGCPEKGKETCLWKAILQPV